MQHLSARPQYKKNAKPYRSRQSIQEQRWAYLLLAPTFVILCFVVVYPLVQAITMSLQYVSLLDLSTRTWVGLNNFIALFQDATFWQALLNTVIYVFFSVVGGLLVGLGLALVLNEKLPLRSVLRSLALIPWVVPGVVVALLFLYIFNPQAGIVDYLLTRLGLAHSYLDWFGSLQRSLPAEIVANVWNQTPFYMLMILAGLQTVPEDQYEAAEIDGASSFAKFRYVTYPHIFGVLTIVTALMVIWNFNSFDTIWATTEGGPVNATMTLSVYVYRTAFNSQNVGYASAIGVVWLVLLLIFSVFFVRVIDRRGER